MIGSIPETEKNVSKFIGLRNIVTYDKKWSRLIFYEIDGHDEHKMFMVKGIFYRMPISWVMYKTLHGYHVVGLTPITASQEGVWHDKLQSIVPEYFSGHTIRLSLKSNEEQELVDYSFNYPYLERLASIYIKRFNIPKYHIPIYGDMPKHACVFERYWSSKI